MPAAGSTQPSAGADRVDSSVPSQPLNARDPHRVREFAVQFRRAGAVTSPFPCADSITDWPVAVSVRAGHQIDSAHSKDHITATDMRSVRYCRCTAFEPRPWRATVLAAVMPAGRRLLHGSAGANASFFVPVQYGIG